MVDIRKPEKIPLYLVIKQKIIEILKLEIVQELLFAGLGCLTFIFIYSLLPKTCWDEIYRNIICAIIVIAFFFIFLIFNQTNPQNKFFKINYKRNIVLFTVLNFAILSFLFFRTDFAYSGLSTDNWYRFAFVTRMSYSGYPQDFVYKGYSAFMAPLYWYILALIARVFQIEPYKMVKYGFLFAYYFLPILLFEVWKKIIKQKAEKQHDTVEKLASRAQEEHENMMNLIKQLDNQVKKVNVIQETIVITKIEADKVHKEFIECVDKIHDLERKITTTHEKKRKTKKAEEVTAAHKEADEIFEKFKRGEKLSTEDLMALQKAGLI